MAAVASGAPPAGRPALGELLGVYRLDAVLGEGGMGVVYLAEHTRLGRKVALKLLRPELAGDPVASARFFAEARAVNAIEHPNVVDITDIVEESGYRYYIMELLRGESLAAIEAREPLQPLPRVVDVAMQLASALGAAHDADVVHCDVKPDNVFVETGEGGVSTVKLIDFGIALLPGDASAGPRRTTRELVGTPAYMSPEQSGGASLTYETDVYSFGVLLYQAVAGRLPFEADTVEEMVLNHVGVSPAPPSSRAPPDRGVPPELDELVLHCLAKAPDERPSSMVEVEARLARIRDALRPARGRRGAGVALWKRPRARIAMAAGFGAAVLAIVVAVASGGSADPAPGRAPAAAAGRARPRPAARHASVVVTLDSSPRGAVVRDDSGKLVGVTPCRVSQPKGRTRRYVFQLAGFAAAVRKLAPAADTAVTVNLVPVKAEDPPRGRPKKRPGR